MAWSTRQLADLAGTTVKAVRHYHEIGLLEMPERASNGYKQYGVAHLVRVLQITRLAALGVPLSQVATMGRADEDPDEAIRVLDAELAASIERLQRVRAELALILRHRAPVELPAEFSPYADGMSEADRKMLMIYPRIFNEHWIADLRDLMEDEPRTAADDEFDRLAPDADDATRDRVAAGIAPGVRRQQQQHARLSDIRTYASGNPDVAQSTVLQAVRELYSPAQLDVLYRAHLLAQDDA